MTIASRARGARRRIIAAGRALRGQDRDRGEHAAGKVTTRTTPAAKPRGGGYDDVDQETFKIIAAVKPYTMTGRDKLIALIGAVRHLARTGLPGTIVECGVWRGGSMHAVARTLIAEGVRDRELYLFDTFAGMTEPTDQDVRTDGRPAADMLATSPKTTWVWGVASREEVEAGLRTLDYPYERFHLVEGPVEQTIPDQAPPQIALLRLDTDWHESTRHELEHLYPRLVRGGVLIIDDYGSWRGARAATDEFLAKLEQPPLLHRAGRSRIGVKP